MVAQDVICAHPETQELFIYDTETIPHDAKTDVITWGKVALMRVMLDAHTVGVVADLRYVLDPNLFLETVDDEAPDDPEEYNEWLYLRKHEKPVSAIVFHEGDGTTVGWLGDEAFRDAAYSLAQVIDETRTSKKSKKHTTAKAKREDAEKPTLAARWSAFLGNL